MTLDQLDTPFERRRVIEYGKDGKKVVRHWYEVQNVIGPLYKSRNTKNQQGEILFTLFIFFPDAENGLLYARMSHPDWYTVERMADSIKRDRLDSSFRMFCDLNERMKKNQFIGNAEIEFVRQFDQFAAERYAQYRLDYYARMEEQQRQKQAAQQAEEEQAKAEQQAKLAAAKALYLGWVDNMTPMHFGRVHKKMEQLVRIDGKVMSRRGFVTFCIKNGWTPQKEDGVTTRYGSRWNPKESRPKTAYTFIKDSLSYKICKTEYDFAMYLMDHKDKL